MGDWVLRERFATNGGAIAWDRLGDGPPVVLVHGTPWSSWSWRRVAAELADRGARLATLLELWGLERPAVIAHDIGGAAALRAHLLHDRAVAALALVDVVALAPWGSPFYRLVRVHREVFEQLP